MIHWAHSEKMRGIHRRYRLMMNEGMATRECGDDPPHCPSAAVSHKAARAWATHDAGNGKEARERYTYSKGASLCPRNDPRRPPCGHNKRCHDDMCRMRVHSHHAAGERCQCEDADAPLQPSVRLIRRQLCTVEEPRQERPVPETPTRRMGGRLASAQTMTRSRPIQTLLLLWVLYCVQGLPFGFQSKSLPLLLRERGFTLRHIGYANLLSMPWTCKFLVSPFVDRWGASSSWGRRRVWILPMQCCLIAACLLAAAIFVRDPQRHCCPQALFIHSYSHGASQHCRKASSCSCP